MRKHLFLTLFSIFAFTSCSSDDDASTGPDPVLGTWAVVAVEPPVFDPAACPEESIVTFHEDNSASTIVYLENNECVPESDEGEWENLGGNSYQIIVPGLGTQTGEVSFEDSDRFTFAASLGTVTFERR